MLSTVLLKTKSNFKIFAKNAAIVTASVFAFFLSIQLIGAGIGAVGQSFVESILQVTSNPFIGLFIGLLITAILQSSSTTTTMSVALVASGSIGLEQAIPIIIGANIGTTITSTLVSLSYITKTAEFRKAISAGTSHDIYNILLALIILPLELNYQFLSTLSREISTSLPILYSDQTMFNGISRIFGPINGFFVGTFGPIITTLIAIFLLFFTVKSISNTLYKRWIGDIKSQADNVIFHSKYKSFGFGLVITSVIQSSSLTTSLIVPLAATGKVKIDRAFDFILGANLGTTITALLAALFKSEAAMSLAIAHFLFNFIGTVLFLNIPYLSRLTTLISDRLGLLTLRNRMTGFIYILFTFFIIPFTLIYFSTDQNDRIVDNSARQETEKVEQVLQE
jgi:sodium-dependent phosphate cotransporter